jgi:hypothetical protein
MLSASSALSVATRPFFSHEGRSSACVVRANEPVLLRRTTIDIEQLLAGPEGRDYACRTTPSFTQMARGAGQACGGEVSREASAHRWLLALGTRWRRATGRSLRTSARRLCRLA